MSSFSEKDTAVGSTATERRRIRFLWDDRVKSVELPGPFRTISLGRSDDNDIVLPDASVSRRHAELVCGEDLSVRDVGSSNGVRVAGRKLSSGETAVIPPGTAVEFGQVVGVYFLGGEAAPEASPPSRRPVVKPIVSEAMARVERLADLASASLISVILTGETGVGKDVLARRIHAQSSRSSGPFIAVNCAAIAESLLQSELFGHEKGAFTGAVGAKIGLLEAAHGGTLFLDEVGELPLTVQASLLRALEAREVLPVGGIKPRPFDARLLAATHRDIEQRVAEGSFRQDLYYRLNGVTIEIPPLRERPEELAGLAREFVATLCKRNGHPTKLLDDAALDALRTHDWPGNIRELRNVIDRAVMLAGNASVISRAHVDVRGAPRSSFGLRASIPVPAASSNSMKAAPPGTDSSGSVNDDPLPDPGSGSLTDELGRIERQRILAALEKTAGNQTQAAKLLGMSRFVLMKRISEYGLARPKKGRAG